MASEVARITPSQEFGRKVSALAEKELVTLFGSDVGRQASARVALAFRAAAATAKDPDAFFSCSPESVASAMATSAFTSIMPGGPFCGCYLIPKKVNGVQTLNWWINHRGIKVLARRAGQGIEAIPYFPGDEVVIVRGKDWRVEVIEGDCDNRDSIENLEGFLYYVTDLSTGALLAARKVSKALIRKRRDKGQGGQVWGEWPMEMAEKTVIKYAAGRGDVFFDDVGNMALSRDADATEPEVEVSVAPSTGRRALGIGVPAGTSPMPDATPERERMVVETTAETVAADAGAVPTLTPKQSQALAAVQSVGMTEDQVLALTGGREPPAWTVADLRALSAEVQRLRLASSTDDGEGPPL